jgi:hypothetical protein
MPDGSNYTAAAAAEPPKPEPPRTYREPFIRDPAFCYALQSPAGCHGQGKRLRTSDNITLDYLRGNKLSRRVWDSYEAIVAACKEAWQFLVGDQERINSIARRSWAWVNP